MEDREDNPSSETGLSIKPRPELDFDRLKPQFFRCWRFRTDTEMKKITDELKGRGLADFSDGNARLAGFEYRSIHKLKDGSYKTVRLLNGGKCESGTIAATTPWAFTTQPFDLSKYGTYANSTREYHFKGKDGKEHKYLIYLTHCYNIFITENEQVVFRTKELFKGLYNGGNGFNFNRNVHLEGGLLLCLSIDGQLLQYDLDALLALEDKSQYKATVLHQSPIIDFCVNKCLDKDNSVITITEDGLMTNLTTGHSFAFEAKDQMKFTTIARHADLIVTEGLIII